MVHKETRQWHWLSTGRHYQLAKGHLGDLSEEFGESEGRQEVTPSCSATLPCQHDLVEGDKDTSIGLATQQEGSDYLLIAHY